MQRAPSRSGDLFQPALVNGLPGVSKISRYSIKTSQVAPKTMNLSSEHCNMSDWLRLEATVKVSVYMVAFSFATLITVIIITIISQNSKLRKEKGQRLWLEFLPGGQVKTLSLQWRENGTSVPRGSGESMPEHSSEPRGLWEASGLGTVGKACSKMLHA
ncbi:hypothetical protein R6Z07F_003293 [Ovis aries]